MSIEISLQIDHQFSVAVVKSAPIGDQLGVLLHLKLGRKDGTQDDVYLRASAGAMESLLRVAQHDLAHITQSHVDAVAEVNAALDGEEEA